MRNLIINFFLKIKIEKMELYWNKFYLQKSKKNNLKF